jgi:hypothetical protein
LFNDDKVANVFEALVGTLRAAKKKKIISYDGELLLQGVHDKVLPFFSGFFEIRNIKIR